LTEGDQPVPAPTTIRTDFTALNASPRTSEFDITRAQESVRHWLSWSLVAIFGLTIFLSFATIWFDTKAWIAAKDLFTIAISTESALLGSAIGFYFGTKK
jgi:hypothetical protein